MDAKVECLEILGVDETLAFLQLFGIALQHYVTARVALQNGFVYPGCLLAQQAWRRSLKQSFDSNPRRNGGMTL